MYRYRFFRKYIFTLNFITEYPLWFFVFCILLGAGYTALLYYRSSAFEGGNPNIARLMASFRFISVTLISFLLLGPLLKTIFREVEKPVVIVAQDNSESVLIGKDSAFYKTIYKENLEELIKQFQNDYDVKTYSFGSAVKQEISFEFSDKETDISELMEEINTRYSNRNVGALILASDGLYNRGMSPLYKSSKFNFPVYAIALGDTNVKKDLILSKVGHNRIAYLGNTFPLEIYVNARQLVNREALLTVSKGNKKLFSQKLLITGEKFSATIPVLLEAKETGVQRYNIQLSHLDGEINYSNNGKDVFIDVLDGRQKVLILANSPHPDVAALKMSIESNNNYEVHVAFVADFKKVLSEYNLVILHQLPSLNNPAAAILDELEKHNIPRLFILGTQSSLNHFNNRNSGLFVAANQGKQNESQPLIADNLTLFTLSDHALNAIKKFPPALTPFGTYKSSGSAYIFMKQKIGMINTSDPLILFNATDEAKTGVIAGEGIWRWRIADYAGNDSHEAFNEIISKIVQYLAVKVNKNHFRVNSKNNFFENQTVEFDAELYNDIFELINEPEVSLTITNNENKRFPFVFTKTSTAYKLTAGIFPVGEYKYEAKVKSGDKLLTQSGEFSVSALQAEALVTEADHQLLYSLTKKQDGEMVYPEGLRNLYSLIKAREDVKPVVYTQQRLNEMINLKWVFFIILVLLSVEWFLRKRSGAY